MGFWLYIGLVVGASGLLILTMGINYLRRGSRSTYFVAAGTVASSLVAIGSWVDSEPVLMAAGVALCVWFAIEWRRVRAHKRSGP